MSRLPLTFAGCRYDWPEAIRDGDVVVEGVDLNCITLKSGRDVLDRMVGGREFDVAELSQHFIAQPIPIEDMFVPLLGAPAT
ncbi:MAG TPA: hypothetical protein VG145_00190 [Xanthobacteraceae bacterium]|nr:hypothetical protein [Xanthobacteraceae bacterium]